MPSQMPQKPASIVAIGALHLDEIALPFASLEMDASNPVRWQQFIGGVAANAARVCSQDLPTTLIAAVGCDATAQQLENGLMGLNVDTQLVYLEGRTTGRYSAILNADGKLFVGLADVAQAEALGMEHISQRLPLSTPKAIMADSNLRTDVLQAIAQHSQQLASTGSTCRLVALNVSPFKVDRWRPIAASVDLFICNKAEAARIAKLPPESSLPQLAAAIQVVGFKQFVITDGGNPVLVGADGEHHLVDVPSITMVDSVNGAGDALAGATVAAWCQGQSLISSVVERGIPAAVEVLCGNRPAPQL